MNRLRRPSWSCSSAFLAVAMHLRGRESDRTSNEKLESYSPTPPVYIFRPNDKLEIAFDTRTRNPLYVLERITPYDRQASTSAVKLKRPNTFYEEKTLPEEFRSRPSHYKHSGFDRGHLACASNYMHTTQKELNDTFNLVNISPQVNTMNAGIWSQLERWVQKINAQIFF